MLGDHRSTAVVLRRADHWPRQPQRNPSNANAENPVRAREDCPLHHPPAKLGTLRHVRSVDARRRGEDCVPGVEAAGPSLLPEVHFYVFMFVV